MTLVTSVAGVQKGGERDIEFSSDDVIKIWNYEIYWDILNEQHLKGLLLPKISILGQIVSEILVPFCSDHSIQILLNLTRFLWLSELSQIKKRLHGVIRA